MNVPVLGQHDGRWAGQRVGTGVFDLVKRILINTSIGGYGCLVTCLTMKNLYYGGREGLVNNIDDIFTNLGVYVGKGLDGRQHRSPDLGCNMVDWNAIQRALPNCAHVGVGYYDNVHADLDRIRASIDAGNPVTLEVRWKGVAANMHFVEAVGHNGTGGDILVNDPETGHQQWFSSRLFGSGDARVDILKAHFFQDAIPNNPTPAVAPAPAPAAPPKEEEVTQAQHDSAMTELKQLYEGKLAEVAGQLEAAKTLLSKQSATINQLMADLAKYAPEYVRNWRDGAIYDVLLHEPMSLIDLAGKQPPVSVEGNTLLSVQGEPFMFEGKSYYRTKTSVDRSYWRVVPVGPNVTIEATPAAAPVLNLSPVPPSLNASQQLHAMVADSWLGRIISKFFGGTK